MRSVFLLPLILVGLVAPLWAEAWTTPEFVAETGRKKVQWQGMKALPGRRLLRWTRDDQGMLIQLERGKTVLWRCKALLVPGLLPLRYEAHTENLVVLRGFTRRRQPATEIGDVALALNLSDGTLAWMSDPIVCSREQIGVPNLHRGDRVYETYLSPTLTPVVLARRISDGSAIFWREVPSSDEQPFDVVGRHIDKMALHSDGLQVSLVDKMQNWQTYLFSVQDGSLKSADEDAPPPPPTDQVKRKENQRLWISPGKSISGLKRVKSTSK